MAPSCIEWEPGDLCSRDDPDILHITKVAPSNSGVGRHAAAFDRALDCVGDRSTIGLAVEASDTQRLRVIARLATRVIRHVRSSRPDLVVVDLSGRALAEFFSACMLAALPRRRRPALWIVAHDPPSLVGSTMLVAPLDRRGGRRIGAALSSGLGSRLERWLLRRAAVLLAFSELGATVLRTRYPDATVRAVPLPTELLRRSGTQPVVYCPAGLDQEDLPPVIDAFRTGQIPDPWRLRIGRLSDEGQVSVEHQFGRDRLDRLEFTGTLDQEALDRSFATAAVVVRHRSKPDAGSNSAAASGPVVSALAAGCAVISSDRRGSRRCVAAAGRDIADRPETLAHELVELTSDVETRDEIGRRAVDHIHHFHLPEAVGRYLQAIWQDTKDAAK